jgi:predicted DNA-binding transcriptional regulator AlpA
MPEALANPLRKSRRKAIDGVITNDTVCNLSELAAYLRMGRRTIYDHLRQDKDPYVLQYPRIGKTTPAHYLAWAAKAPVNATEAPADSLQREREKCRLRSSAGKSRARSTTRD